MYWFSDWNTVYALDLQNATKFSSSVLPDVDDYVFEPSTSHYFKFTVTSGRDGKARILFLRAHDNLTTFATTQNDSEWVVEKSIQLSAVMLGEPWYQLCYFSLVHLRSSRFRQKAQCRSWSSEKSLSPTP